MAHSVEKITELLEAFERIPEGKREEALREVEKIGRATPVVDMTRAEVAAHNFVPWKIEDLETHLPNEKFLNGAVTLRICYSLMGKTKPELVDMFNRDGKMLAEVAEHGIEAMQFFEAMTEICRAAVCRLAVAQAAANDEKKAARTKGKRAGKAVRHG